MAWNDGISKELSEAFHELGKCGDIAIEATKEVIDEEAQKFEENIKKNTPVQTGGLRDSLERGKIKSSNYYGYEVNFEGNAPNGQPYQKIANIINYGSASGDKAGTMFISKAVKKLKGMDKRIEARIESKIADKEKETQE